MTNVSSTYLHHNLGIGGITGILLLKVLHVEVGYNVA